MKTQLSLARVGASLFLLSAMTLLVACSSTPLRNTLGAAPAPHVDRERFLGTWHILANIPYFAERGKVATRVEYVKRDDGRVDDLFYFRRSLDGPEQRWSGVAWALDASGARWKARFIWPFSSEFWVIDIDDEVALIATPDAKLAWIYARTPQISAERYQAALTRLAAFGVDTTQMLQIPQP